MTSYVPMRKYFSINFFKEPSKKYIFIACKTNVKTRREGEGDWTKNAEGKAICPFLACVAGETGACYAGYFFLLLVF